MDKKRDGDSPNGHEDNPKGDEDNLRERINRLERRLEELEVGKRGVKGPALENKSSEAGSAVEGSVLEGSVVEGIVGQLIPGLGGIVRALETASPEFRQRIADTDKEIKHRIDVGWSSKPVVDYHVSTRPLRRGVPPKRSTPEIKVSGTPSREPIVDVFEEGDLISVIAELPGVDERELEVRLDGGVLDIRAGGLVKRVDLSGDPEEIVDRSYKNGILQLKVRKKSGVKG